LLGIGERGFVLGWKLGMTMEEDPITQALEASSKQKDNLEKVFCQFGSPNKSNNHGVERLQRLLCRY
jgi:hypothetical protein